MEEPPNNGHWTFARNDDGTRVRFEADFEAPRVLARVMKPLMRRQFRGYHRKLQACLIPPERGAFE